MKTIEYFNKAVAEKMGVDQHLVKKINDYFWRIGVRRNIAELNHRSLYIKDLGTITVSRYKLYQRIETVIKRIRRLRDSDRFKELTKERKMANYYQTLKAMLRLRNEIAIEYYNKEL